MPVGSFWTQPKGESHITSAKGADCVALVEIDQGPYLVLSEDEHFDSGERPVNVVSDNVVWVDIESSPESKIAYLWVDLKGENGTFLKLPAGFSGTISTYAPRFRAVVIQGALGHADVDLLLQPGSYFGSSDPSEHRLSSIGGQSAIVYINTNGDYVLDR